jgi:predicted RNA polymerase sigma factor
MVREGLSALDRAASGDAISRYTWRLRLLLVMRSLGAWQETDWPRILECYTVLTTLTGSPIVRLNAAIARSHVDGPHAAIAELEPVVAHAALVPRRPRLGAISARTPIFDDSARGSRGLVAPPTEFAIARRRHTHHRLRPRKRRIVRAQVL